MVLGIQLRQNEKASCADVSNRIRKQTQTVRIVQVSTIGPAGVVGFESMPNQTNLRPMRHLRPDPIGGPYRQTVT